MKAMELEFADLVAAAKRSRDTKTLAELEVFEKKTQKMQESYGQFVDRRKIYEKKISEEERLILKMARTFGECEIFMPDDFADEVKRYIEKWKTTNRFNNAVNRAVKMGYRKPIAASSYRDPAHAPARPTGVCTPAHGHTRQRR